MYKLKRERVTLWGGERREEVKFMGRVQVKGVCESDAGRRAENRRGKERGRIKGRQIRREKRREKSKVGRDGGFWGWKYGRWRELGIKDPAER